MVEPVALAAPIPQAAKLAARLKNPFLFRGFMLAKLPLALVAGLRVRELDTKAFG